jgi:hypothetical protein
MHTQGWCDCQTFHVADDPVLTGRVTPREPVELGVSVASLIGERDPITGKIKEHNLTLEQIKMLVFNDGSAAWNEFNDVEKRKFQEYLHEAFVEATTRRELRYVRAYFGDMLMRMGKDVSGSPFVGERV